MRAQLQQLREAMAREKIDVYLITMDDEHQSEYVSDHFREIAEVTGFTGSAGTFAAAKDKAALWTDGRYFVQAEKQLEGTGIELMKSGVDKTPAMEEFIAANIPDGGCLGFNGKCVSCNQVNDILKAAAHKNISVSCKKDLVDDFWKDRPKKPCEPVFILEEKYAGLSYDEKLKSVREAMAQKDADVHIITSLDDICWILNLRGRDITCNPVFSSFLLISHKEVTLYTDKGHITEEAAAYLKENSITLKDEDCLYDDILLLENCSVLAERSKANYSIISSLSESVHIIDEINPSSLMKCYKNKTEMENLKKAHIKDGVAVTRFMYWFKHTLGRQKITEWDAALKMEELREEQPNFIEDSFTTIAAYGPNAAMCHYEPSEDINSEIGLDGLFLLDSGGHYLEGTTDITRTWGCKNVTEQEKLHYTYCVMANLRLSDVVFLEGSSGMSIDYAAREVFWKHKLNFNHGTGHGVGYCLNVHERPVGIRYKIVPERQDSYVLKEGAFVSNEPGIYIAGEHGIRIENLMMCVNDVKNEYGQFLKFETYTLCPIETDILIKDEMSKRDIELLNEYNQKVYITLKEFLPENEADWLRKVCEPI